MLPHVFLSLVWAIASYGSGGSSNQALQKEGPGLPLNNTPASCPADAFHQRHMHPFIMETQELAGGLGTAD